MARPNPERLREFANKRVAKKGTDREVRKKRRHEGAPQPRASRVGISIREARTEESEPQPEFLAGPTPPLGAEDWPSAGEIADAVRVVTELVDVSPSGAGESAARERAEREEEPRGKAPVVEPSKPSRPIRRNIPPPPLPPGPMVGDNERPLTSFPGRNKGESTSAVEAICQTEGSDAAPASVGVSDAALPASDEGGVAAPPAERPPAVPAELIHPEGWPEAHRPPGSLAGFSAEEWVQVRASAKAALESARLVELRKRVDRETEEAYCTAYADAVYWKRAAARWENECAPWADVAGKRGKEIDRLNEELSTVGQLARSLQQTSVEQERDLEALQRNYGAVRGQKEYLERRLGEVEAEPAALRAELAAVQARLEASERELAESRSEGSKLRADSDAALAQKEEELRAATLQAEKASEEHAAAQALLTDCRTEVDRLATRLREVLAEAKSASEAHGREAASFRLEMEGRMTRAITDYKASQSFQDEIDESGSLSYEIGFQDGLQQVRASYPDLDLSIIRRAGEGADEDDTEDSSEGLSGEDEGPPAPGEG